MDDVRIETEANFMLDIVRDVQKGRAAPAAFQRPFVWTAHDVEALWTSILRGYPLGAFLLWRPKGGIVHSRPTLGPIPLQPGDHAALILDGQNRLVTIAWSMTAPDDDVPDGTLGSDIFQAGRHLVMDPYEKRRRRADEPGRLRRGGGLRPKHQHQHELRRTYPWTSRTTPPSRRR